MMNNKYQKAKRHKIQTTILTLFACICSLLVICSFDFQENEYQLYAPGNDIANNTTASRASCTVVHGVNSAIETEQFHLDSNGQPIFWNQKDYIQVEVNVNDIPSAQMRDEIHRAVTYWNNQIEVPFLAYHISTSNLERPLGSIRIVLDPLLVANDCASTFLGTTTRFYSPSHMTNPIFQPLHSRRFHNNDRRSKRMPENFVNGALIKIWDQVEVETEEQKMDAQRLLVHELGHALGLKHDRDINSVMYPRVEKTAWEVEPRDIEYVRQIAEHLR